MQVSDINLRKFRLLGGSDRLAACPSVPGFLVVDASLEPLFASHEAIAVLTYPAPVSHSAAQVFHKKVRPGLLKHQDSARSENRACSFMKLKSGRRTYFCRTFPLSSSDNGDRGTATLVVLERGMSLPLALSQVSQQFHLTNREQQTVALLLQGLSNKELGQKMGISSNTAKSFLYTAAIKMGVGSRCGIVAQVLGLLLSSYNSD
jgi:DNA-binding CsgD family transcriptional regulator